MLRRMSSRTQRLATAKWPPARSAHRRQYRHGRFLIFRVWGKASGVETHDVASVDPFIEVQEPVWYHDAAALKHDLAADDGIAVDSAD